MSESEFADLPMSWGMTAALSAIGASVTFLSVSGFGVWTSVGTVLHRSHDARASMDSGQLDSTHPSSFL